jgi:hypothetical protein
MHLKVTDYSSINRASIPSAISCDNSVGPKHTYRNIAFLECYEAEFDNIQGTFIKPLIYKAFAGFNFVSLKGKLIQMLLDTTTD